MEIIYQAILSGFFAGIVASGVSLLIEKLGGRLGEGLLVPLQPQ